MKPLCLIVGITRGEFLVLTVIDTTVMLEWSALMVSRGEWFWAWFALVVGRGVVCCGGKQGEWCGCGLR